MIRGSSLEREKALRIIYQTNREKVCSYILSNSGDEDEAKDIFQESMVAFYENVRDGKFKSESTIGTYLYSIARFKWLNQIKKNSIRMVHDNQFKPSEDYLEGPLATIIDEENKKHIIEVFDLLGASCKQILIESFYHNSSMKEIAKITGISSDQVVRNKKYKCIKRLKELIAEKPILNQILKSYGS